MKISVIICTYNYAHFLPQCLESVMGQTRPVDEVIVVDDGSTDGTGDVVARFPEINYIRKERGGKACAFNTGFAASQGDVICHLDADDYWLPRKIERSLAVLSQTGCGGLTHDAFYVDADNRYLYGSDQESDAPNAICRYSLWEVLEMGFVYRPRNAFAGRIGVANSICVLRSALADCFPLPRDLGLAIDGALLLGAARRTLAYLPEKLSAYRHHGKNSFVANTNSLDFQSRLLKWAAGVASIRSPRDVRLLRAVQIESEIHSAIQNEKQSAATSWRAAALIGRIAGLGLIPHWKHFGLPVVALVGRQRIRRLFRNPV